MSQLENPRFEAVAQFIAAGSKWPEAVVKAGYSDSSRNVVASKAHILRSRPDVRARITELQESRRASIEAGAGAAASELDIQAVDLWTRAIAAVPVRGVHGKHREVCECGKPYEVNVWRCDFKQALGVLDFRAKLAGLYVKNVNVRHIKNEIEGTLDQIWERVADMAEPLGREFKEWLIARWGYEVVPANLRVVSGTVEDAGAASKTAS